MENRLTNKQFLKGIEFNHQKERENRNKKNSIQLNSAFNYKIIKLGKLMQLINLKLGIFLLLK